MVNKKEILGNIKRELERINECELEEKVEFLNELKCLIAKYSPFSDPVDVVRWIPGEQVVANEYNPNRVAPPEMKLLEISIKYDGYTQPIVAFPEDGYYTVVDGFHRNRVGKESEEVRERIHGYLPLVVINKPLNERMASTIRHNRARGTHAIQPMSKVVEELYFMGWSNKRIALELGMDKDEVLRLKQFTGLGNLFKFRDFSKSWIGDNYRKEKDVSSLDRNE